MKAAEIPTGQLIGFWYDGRLFIRVVPSKNLFRSTMVHEVVNRMDVFAMEMATQQFTVIPGKAEVEPTKISWMQLDTPNGQAPGEFKRVQEELAERIRKGGARTPKQRSLDM